MRALRVLFKVALSLSLAGLIILFLPHGASGTDGSFTLDTHVNYRIDGNTTTATEQYSVTNQTAREFLTKITLSTPVDTISGVHAQYADGTSIAVTATPQTSNRTGISYNYQNLTLTFPRQIYGDSKAWSFSVNYTATGLAESHGGAHTVYLPAVQPDSLSGNYSVRVDVPASFGTPHLQGAGASATSSENGRQYFDFTKQALLAKSLALSFGDQSNYQVNFNFPLSNSSFSAKTVSVTLPPKLNNQQVRIESLDPAPANTHVDADGNILADYHLAPSQHLTVKTVITGQVNYLDYNLAASGRASAIPANLVHEYTGATQYWQTGGAVGAAAKSLTDPNKPVIQNVQAMYQYVIDHLTYNPAKIKFNIRQGATKALADPNNVVCLEYSDLLIAMLRSQGIPARMPIGYGYSGNLKASSSVVDSLHSWVEAYVPGIGWMTLDPTWGEKFDLFGQSDLDHFAFAVWGNADQSPGAVMTDGHDDGYQYEQTALSYVNATQTVPASGTVELVRRPILPGLSIDELKVNATGDETGYYQVQYDGRNHDLGSLAPGQHFKRYGWTFGRNWSKATALTLTDSAGQQNLVLARSNITTQFSLFWVITGVLAIGLLGIIVVRLRPHRTEKSLTHD